MTRTHRHARKCQTRHQLAHRALVQLHAEVSGDFVAQIGQAPTNNFVLFERRAPANPCRKCRLLLGRQLARRRAPFRPVLQPLQSALVVAMHPVTQRLPIHSRCPRRCRPIMPLQHQSKRQHPPSRGRVLATCRRRPQTLRIKVAPRNRHRHRCCPVLLKAANQTGTSRSNSRSSQLKRRLVLDPPFDQSARYP